MQRISSSSTFFFKRVVPMVMLAVVVAGTVVSVLKPGDEWRWQLLWSLVFVVAYGVLFRKLTFGIADEVQVTTDALVFRRGGIHERILLKDVLNVSVTRGTNPRRVTLRLRKADRFGDEVSFIPESPFSFNTFSRDPVAEDLIHRIDRARGGA
jgi:hypothetical protein